MLNVLHTPHVQVVQILQYVDGVIQLNLVKLDL